MNLAGQAARLTSSDVARRLPIRAIALVGLVGLAYHYSLGTLARGLALQTPLAFLGLVPIIALGLAWIRLAREPSPRPIHDRQVDYIIGLEFIALATVVLLLPPLSLDTRYWLYRIDLLSLPLFVAGLVSVLWGVRRLWALRVPIVFLLLAWPLPYTPLVTDWTDTFTEATAAALGAIATVLPVAQPAPGDGLVFYIGEGPSAFAVSVGSVCAGVNSLVGFVLIGTALIYIVRGSKIRRALWLLTGLTIVWLLNIVRIEAIFVVGSLYGRQAALDVLHPVAGLIFFNVGIGVMLLAVPWFGLRFAAFETAGPTAALRTPAPARRIRPALLTAGVLAIALAFVNGGLARYEAIATPLGEAKRLQPFDIRQAQVAGWSSDFMASNELGKQFFGSTSTWDRIQYSPTETASLRASTPVYVDVIGTEDPGTFAAYGMQACYSFHGYRIESVARVDIGSGVTAEVIDYRNRKIDADWSAIWWEWPYQKDGRTWFERIIVFVASGPTADYTGIPTVDIASQSPRFAETDRFLTALAREMLTTELRTASR